MFVSQEDLLPLAGGAIVVAALRCMTLLIGLVLALRGAPKADRVLMYRAFTHALGPTFRRERLDSKDRQARPPNAD